MKSVRNPSFLKSWGHPTFIHQQQYWYVALSCAGLHGGWWISNQSTNRDLTFILLFPACHPTYPAIAGDRKKKRAKCWVALVWHKSCFVFGITKVGSIIHQDWTKGQRASTKQLDNGFPVDAVERLQTRTHTQTQTHTHTSCCGLHIICFEHLAYCCCCNSSFGIRFIMNWIFIRPMKSGSVNDAVNNYWKVNFFKPLSSLVHPCVFMFKGRINYMCLRWSINCKAS